MKFNYAPLTDRRLVSWNYIHEANTILELLSSNEIIYDIGANIFDHSIYFALKRPNAKIYSFEPIPSLFEMGLNNIKDFNVNNVIGFNVGIGDKKDELNISFDNEGSSFVRNEGHEQIKVKIDTLDLFVKENNLPLPTVIKIDIEGYALPALNGMKQVIDKSHPLFILEIHPVFVGVEEAIKKVKFLYDRGYKIIKYLNNREFILKHQLDGVTFDEFITKFRKDCQASKLTSIRSTYDSALSKKERQEAKAEYKSHMYKGRPISKWLLWSKLYVFFTLKIFTKR